MLKKLVIILLVLLFIIAAIFVCKEVFFKNDTKNSNIDNNINNDNSENNNEDENLKVDEENNKKELFEDYYSKAEEMMKNMTIEEKVGQMFLARCPSDSSAVNQISSLKPGGYVLFGRDFNNKTKDQIISTINSYQKASKIPMLIAVDEEGGSVVRVSSNRNLSNYTFKSSQELYNEGGYEAIKSDTKEKAKLLYTKN